MFSSKKGRQSSGYQATTDDDRQSSGSRKSNPARPPEKGLKCPRCDSSNTKFCYYNNYSLKQPRYFCKACRRYWTNGGALRTVPFGGGGARKRKQIVEPSSKFIKNHDYYSTGIFNFFQGFNPPPVDFELATHSPGATNPNPLLGQGMNFTLSSIESLSSINQDIYWKLQQQRLALLFGGENQNKKETNHAEAFAMGNCSRKEGANGNLATETWPFDSSNATTSYSNIAINYGSNGIHEGTSSWVNGIQPWTDLNQYSGAVA